MNLNPGTLTFVPLPEPTTADIEALTFRIAATELLRRLASRGVREAWRRVYFSINVRRVALA